MNHDRLTLGTKIPYFYADSFSHVTTQENEFCIMSLIRSVSDPFHFDMDPDPRIRFEK